VNANEIQKYVMRYLEATDCLISEKTTSHLTVRLSPQADKELMNRPYYWSFVENTAAQPQTMSMMLAFDDTVTPPDTRIPFDVLTYGSNRLEQIFKAVQSKGRFVQMYEDLGNFRGRERSLFHTWMVVNYKIEFICDMKRDELHSLGISLVTGKIVDDFYDRLNSLPLTPRMPENTVLERCRWSVTRAATHLEQYVEREIRNYDHTWAAEAKERLDDELARVDEYYAEYIESAEPEHREAIASQYEDRRREIFWQYNPRISIQVLNTGIFQLCVDKSMQNFLSFADK
jgi:hypothetical protein